MIRPAFNKALKEIFIKAPVIYCVRLHASWSSGRWYRVKDGMRSSKMLGDSPYKSCLISVGIRQLILVSLRQTYSIYYECRRGPCTLLPLLADCRRRLRDNVKIHWLFLCVQLKYHSLFYIYQKTPVHDLFRPLVWMRSDWRSPKLCL